MSAMKRLFQLMAEKKASDIFISVGSPINIKINGSAVPVNQQSMTRETVKQLLYEVLNAAPDQGASRTSMELNIAVRRWRASAASASARFRQKGSPAVVVRYIPATIPPLDTPRPARRC